MNGKLLGEWRGHRYWTDNNEPRIRDYRLCTEEAADALWCENCMSKYDLNGQYEKVGGMDDRKACPGCHAGILIGRQNYNPLLEAYVEGLWWLMAVANDLNLDEDELYVTDDLIDVDVSSIFIDIIHLIATINLKKDQQTKRLTFRAALFLYRNLGDKQLGLTPDQIETSYYAHHKEMMTV